MAGSLSSILDAVKPEPKVGEKPTVKRKYIQFTLEEWQAMEANAGETFTTTQMKSLLQGIFAGKVNLTVAPK